MISGADPTHNPKQQLNQFSRFCTVFATLCCITPFPPKYAPYHEGNWTPIKPVIFLHNMLITSSLHGND